MFSKAIIIQPPLVQLNTAYPSGAYLNSFFKNQNLNSKWYDLSIELFNSIFSSAGLKKLFSLTEQKALSLAQEALKNGDESTSENLTSYILQKDLWIDWIDDIINILRDGTDSSTREICHKFIYSPFVPHGNRMNNYMENADHEVTIDDARNLATMAVEDLADYVAFVYDQNFSLIRYAESITVNEHSFAQIEKTLDSPLLNDFYRPILEDNFKNLNVDEEAKTLVCISVPFAGTFTAALFTAKFFKEKFKEKTFVSLGGGFVNTELREFSDSAFYKYADALSFDRGYGSYIQLLNRHEAPVYNMRIFSGKEIFEPLSANDERCSDIVKIENETTGSTVPDYSDIDFSKYPRMADDTNPMQRMWSDGTWFKAYLAHGCYWHRCSFCDVTLDYVKSYRMTCVDKIFDGLSQQCNNKKIRGIHFVDEALPPAAVKKFSLLNIKKNSSALSFWGNVRFEKVWNRDITDLCAKGGLIGVSGGIEIATGSGLDKISKGTDLESIVSACCAFKESGILIHAYMIFGYYGESEQDIINSMETLRQFFDAGLLDSCFWHKFVLTRHSRLYDEWTKGMHKDLKPFENKDSGIFAKNGIHFEGENSYDKYSDGLNQSLQNWMHGKGINKSVNKWFAFKTKEPTVSKNLVADAIAKYEAKRDSLYSRDFDIEKENPVWICDGMILNGTKLMWSYMQETYRMKNVSSDLFDALKNLEPKNYDPSKIHELIKKAPEAKQKLLSLRGRGLIL